MTTIKIETETITTDLTPSEAAAKIKEALGIAEFPQIGDVFWFVDDGGYDAHNLWQDTTADYYRLSIGNCSPTQEGLARYKAVMAKVKALWAIEQHRDKTFGVFELRELEERYYGHWNGETWDSTRTDYTLGGITVPFFSDSDIQRSFKECGEHWEVLK